MRPMVYKAINRDACRIAGTQYNVRCVKRKTFTRREIRTSYKVKRRSIRPSIRPSNLPSIRPSYRPRIHRRIICSHRFDRRFDLRIDRQIDGRIDGRSIVAKPLMPRLYTLLWNSFMKLVESPLFALSTGSGFMVLVCFPRKKWFRKMHKLYV
jgi:hypothetical protein